MTDLSHLQDPLGLQRLGYAAPLLDHPALQWVDGVVTPRTEHLIEETPVVLAYNGAAHVVMMTTPEDLEDFGLGFSLTEELIQSPADIRSMEIVRYSQGIEVQMTVPAELAEKISGRSRKLSGRTGCGICGSDTIADVLKALHPVKAAQSIPPRSILRALEALSSHQALNAASGAVHAAAWATTAGEIVLVREDVGRHNALDKLIGALVRSGTAPDSGFLMVTSRASFEMVQKATVFGSPLLAAVSGPTGLAVRVAHQAGLTLVGFARGERLTIYTHPHGVASG
ncbi:MAG: formate dehydrogenase accessory sulfurtransferase FdhD [Gemmatimonadales bacterium]